jgi:4-aminobutyrate aminotransferase-like enzyme
LFLGVEIVEDFESLRPDAEKTRSLVEAMLRYGVMLGIDGPDHNVLKIKPPMVVDLADADYFLEKLGFALDQ